MKKEREELSHSGAMMERCCAAPCDIRSYLEKHTKTMPQSILCGSRGSVKSCDSRGVHIKTPTSYESS